MFKTFSKFQVCATKTLSVAVTCLQVSDFKKSLKTGLSSMGDFSQESLSLIPNTHGCSDCFFDVCVDIVDALWQSGLMFYQDIQI